MCTFCKKISSTQRTPSLDHPQYRYAQLILKEQSGTPTSQPHSQRHFSNNSGIFNFRFFPTGPRHHLLFSLQNDQSQSYRSCFFFFLTIHTRHDLQTCNFCEATSPTQMRPSLDHSHHHYAHLILGKQIGAPSEYLQF